MDETFSRFDTADYLKTDEDVIAYLEAAAEDGDPAGFALALRTVARVRNIDLSRETDIARERPQMPTLPDGNPAFATVVKVARALGFAVTVRPIAGHLAM